MSTFPHSLCLRGEWGATKNSTWRDSNLRSRALGLRRRGRHQGQGKRKPQQTFNNLYKRLFSTFVKCMLRSMARKILPFSCSFYRSVKCPQKSSDEFTGHLTRTGAWRRGRLRAETASITRTTAPWSTWSSRGNMAIAKCLITAASNLTSETDSMWWVYG